MSVYDDEILSETSLQVYWKGEDLSGTVMMDSSGNGNHGTLFPEAILGVPGPIETDGSSFGIGNRAGEHDTLSGSALDLRGNFTLEAWGAVNDLVQDYGILARNGSFGLNGSNVLGFNSGHIMARVSVASGLANTYDLVDPTPVITGPYYHVAVVRNGATLILYVNAAVRDSRPDFPVGDIIYPAYNEEKWTMGAFRPSGTANFAYRTARVALYNAALSQVRLAAHVEAAFAASLLNGVSNAAPSAILYSDLEPVPTSFPFRHNWADSLIERITFRTNVSSARKGYTENAVIRPKPRREVEISQALRDNSERSRLHAQLTAQQHRKWFIPVLEDRETLTAPLAAGSTVIPATVQYRDYEVGGYVELRQLNSLGQVVKQEHALITSLSPLTTTAIVNSYDAFVSTIGPARRGYIDPQLSLRGHSGAVEDLVIVARLLTEDEKITPNRITPWTPTITYKGFEVFDPASWQSNDWSELRDYNISREVDAVDFDAGSFTQESDALASVETFSYRMLLEGRASQAALLGWFYARAGQANYLWVPTMQADFEIADVSGDDLTVTGHNYSDNFSGSEFRRDLAFVYHDNTLTLRRIESAALDGDNEILTLDSGVPTQTNLRSVSYLRFCQLAGDALEIARATDDVARFAWSFRELLSSPA